MESLYLRRASNIDLADPAADDPVWPKRKPRNGSGRHAAQPCGSALFRSADFLFPARCVAVSFQLQYHGARVFFILLSGAHGRMAGRADPAADLFAPAFPLRAVYKALRTAACAAEHRACDLRRLLLRTLLRPLGEPGQVAEMARKIYRCGLWLDRRLDDVYRQFFHAVYLGHGGNRRSAGRASVPPGHDHQRALRQPCTAPQAESPEPALAARGRGRAGMRGALHSDHDSGQNQRYQTGGIIRPGSIYCGSGSGRHPGAHGGRRRRASAPL